MAETKGKEAIAEGDEEVRGTGWKRVNEDRDKDTRLGKRGKVEGKGCGTQEEEEEQEQEQEVSDKMERLRMLLKDKPRWLRKKEAEEVICYLDVGDIIRCALKSWKVEQEALEGYMCLEPNGSMFVPSAEKVDRLMRLMLLCGVEKLKAVDLYILRNNFPRAAFASMLLRALDSYSKRHLDSGRSVYPKEMRANIGIACSVLSWTLFAHVMYELTSLPVFKCTISTTTGTSEEEEEDEILKKAAENCDICYGKGKHSGVYGYYCSFWQSVPYGVAVGHMHVVHCRYCGFLLRNLNTWVRCWCGSQEGKALPDTVFWEFVNI